MVERLPFLGAGALSSSLHFQASLFSGPALGFTGWERAEAPCLWQLRVSTVSWDLGWAGGSMKISLWWSVWQSLSVPDPGWEHKSPWLARLSISHSRPACPRPQAHSGPLPSRPSPGVRPGPPFTLRTCPSAVLQRAGDEGRPSPGLGQPHPRHPRGSKYYITAGCAVRDLRQAPGLKFPEMEFANCSPHPKNSIKKNNRKNVVRRGPARVVYLAAAVPLRSAVIGSA